MLLTNNHYENNEKNASGLNSPPCRSVVQKYDSTKRMLDVYHLIDIDDLQRAARTADVWRVDMQTYGMQSMYMELLL